MKNNTAIQLNRYVDSGINSTYYKVFDANHPLFFWVGAKVSRYLLRCFFDFNKTVKLQFVDRTTSMGVTITRYKQRTKK